MDILGVNTGHDAGIALIRDGVFVELISEERFSRIKGHQGFPISCVAYVRRKYGVHHFDRVVVISASGRYLTPLMGIPENVVCRARQGEKLFAKSIMYRLGILQIWRQLRIQSVHLSQPFVKKKIDALLKQHFPTERITHMEHHLAHAWSALAFDPSLEDGIVVTLDGEGDGLCGSINKIENGHVRRLAAFPAGTGIGTLYGKVTEFLGMKRNEHEFKVMGLAPYAKPSHGEIVLAEFRRLLAYDADKMKFRAAFNMQYAKYYFIAHNYIRYRFDTIAYAIQRFTEELVSTVVASLRKRYAPPAFYFAGGVFMNIKLNQKLSEQETVGCHFTPSSGDESLAIGAAKYGYEMETRDQVQPISTLYLGTEYSDSDVQDVLFNLDPESYIVKFFGKESAPIERKIASLLAKKEVVARFKGRMEWGARALGNRSILANPSDASAVRRINEMIKSRDFWMPFAPTILDDCADEYLENWEPSPYMAIGFATKKECRHKLAACIHPYDFSCRPQILTRESNPDYYRLIEWFRDDTGIGAILNTSFNLHGYPIVETPADALNVLKNSELRYLAIGNYLVSKNAKLESKPS